MAGKAMEQLLIFKVMQNEMHPQEDLLAIEEPLEIQLVITTATGKVKKNISVTMRTPGHDKDLATGFLFTEGIIKNGGEIESVKIKAADANVIIVTLKQNVTPFLENVARNFYTTSSCGVCGKASIDAVKTVSSFSHVKDNIIVKAALFYGLQKELRKQQAVFQNTGGLHAAALFSFSGNLMELREDVGRHNALDKLLGQALQNNEIPLTENILLLSGRASFELLQKAAMAGIKIIAAVGAPSSLAVELAAENNITLIGFLREATFNIYSGAHRIIV